MHMYKQLISSLNHFKTIEVHVSHSPIETGINTKWMEKAWHFDSREEISTRETKDKETIFNLVSPDAKKSILIKYFFKNLYIHIFILLSLWWYLIFCYRVNNKNNYESVLGSEDRPGQHCIEEQQLSVQQVSSLPNTNIKGGQLVLSQEFP